MYYCKSCGAVFGQAEQDRNGKYICPECGSKRFEQAQQCRICKEYFVSANTYDKYCDDCRRNALDQFAQAVEQHVDPDYIELLRSEYDDIDYIMEGETE